jgi:hypothetical protein
MLSLKNLLTLLIFGSLTLSSCLEEPKIEASMPSQLFRPIAFTGNVDVVTVSFNWAPIKNASYLLEVSTDEFVQNITSVAIDQQSSFVMEDLRSQTRYSARIKAVSKDAGVRDSDYQTLVFTTGLENIFFQIDTAQITTETVDLFWEPLKTVTSLEIVKGDTLLKKVTLTAAQIETGNLLVDGLAPDETYTFRIFNGDILRGTTSAKTKARVVPAAEE